MVSVERVLLFTQLPQERALTSGCKPPASWPSKGDIEFENVTLKYREDLPPTLKNLSFRIHGGEKIGIVGRTGAGKSTITAALFRLVELTAGSFTQDYIFLIIKILLRF